MLLLWLAHMLLLLLLLLASPVVVCMPFQQLHTQQMTTVLLHIRSNPFNNHQHQLAQRALLLTANNKHAPVLFLQQGLSQTAAPAF